MIARWLFGLVQNNVLTAKEQSKEVIAELSGRPLRPTANDLALLFTVASA